jgi:hypothetical protein
MTAVVFNAIRPLRRGTQELALFRELYLNSREEKLEESRNSRVWHCREEYRKVFSDAGGMSNFMYLIPPTIRS